MYVNDREWIDFNVLCERQRMSWCMRTIENELILINANDRKWIDFNIREQQMNVLNTLRRTWRNGGTAPIQMTTTVGATTNEWIDCNVCEPQIMNELIFMMRRSVDGFCVNFCASTPFSGKSHCARASFSCRIWNT